MFILRFELHGITILPCDLRGMKMAATDVIVVLALVEPCPAVLETSK